LVNDLSVIIISKVWVHQDMLVDELGRLIDPLFLKIVVKHGISFFLRSKCIDMFVSSEPFYLFLNISWTGKHRHVTWRYIIGGVHGAKDTL
jgi:hypothetical protein